MKAIAVFAIKGGVGKTAIAVNLAHAAATQSARRTLLWDLDGQGAATFTLRLPMTTELTMLTWTLVLAVIYILAFDLVRTGQYGTKWNMGPRDATMPPLTPVAERLGRAQANLFETLPIFIAVVLIAHAAGVHTRWTVLGAELYFWMRLAYLPLYAFGVPVVRSLVWLVSFAGLLMIILAVL